MLCKESNRDERQQATKCIYASGCVWWWWAWKRGVTEQRATNMKMFLLIFSLSLPFRFISLTVWNNFPSTFSLLIPALWCWNYYHHSFALPPWHWWWCCIARFIFFNITAAAAAAHLPAAYYNHKTLITIFTHWHDSIEKHQ